MPKNLIIRNHKIDAAQEAMQFFVKLDVLLQEPVIIRFISINRQDTAMIIIHSDDKLEKTVKYPLGISYENTLINKQLVPMLELLGVFLSSDDKNELIKLANNCLHKCESRFGIHVKNYDEVGYSDAVITISGENGKAKRRVIIMDNEDKDKTLSEEDLDIELPNNKLNGEVCVIEGNIVWTHDKEDNTLEEVINFLQSNFENPYIIITPYQNVILDLRMETGKYDSVYELETSLYTDGQEKTNETK